MNIAFKEEYLLENIKASEIALLVQAYSLFEEDDFLGGHKLIDKLVLQKEPLALVLSSTFSKNGENKDQFNERHIKLLQLAGFAKDPLALYSLGVYSDTGNFLELDKQVACKYFKESAELGMPQAKYIYGVMLYYGTGGADQDKERGLSMVKSSASAGVSESAEFLAYLNNTKL